MHREVHFGFGVVEAVVDALFCEDQAHDLDVGAARKAENGDGHGIAPRRRGGPDLQGEAISPAASARRAGKVQCLGEMPWESRATAFEPDAASLTQSAAKVNPAAVLGAPTRQAGAELTGVRAEDALHRCHKNRAGSRIEARKPHDGKTAM